MPLKTVVFISCILKIGCSFLGVYFRRFNNYNNWHTVGIQKITGLFLLLTDIECIYEIYRSLYDMIADHFVTVIHKRKKKILETEKPYMWNYIHSNYINKTREPENAGTNRSLCLIVFVVRISWKFSSSTVSFLFELVSSM